MSHVRTELHVLLLLLLPLVATGCLAVAAGGAAGAAASQGDDVEYYLKTHEVEPDIREAMQNARIIEGMNATQVRLVMGEKTDYNARPNSVKDTGDGEVWVYENNDPMTVGKYLVKFENEKVVTHGLES